MILAYATGDAMHHHLMLLIHQRLRIITLDDSMARRHLGRVLISHVALHFLPPRPFPGLFLLQETLDPFRPPAQLLQARPPARLLLRPLQPGPTPALAIQTVLPPM